MRDSYGNRSYLVERGCQSDQYPVGQKIKRPQAHPTGESCQVLEPPAICLRSIQNGGIMIASLVSGNEKQICMVTHIARV